MLKKPKSHVVMSSNDSSLIKMPDCTDKRAQPWQKWYTPSNGEVTAGRHLVLMQNNGSDNKHFNVFATSSSATTGTTQRIEAQLAEKKKGQV